MKIKKILFLLLIISAILLIPNVVNAAETIDTNGITWVYDLQNEQATNVMPKDKNTLPAELIIPSELDGYPVKSIGERAFSHCNNYTDVTIPDTVITIADGAFQCCKGLKSIKMPEGITTIGDFMFDQCDLLEEINIPNSLQKIEKYAFYGCKKLDNITLPNTLTEIGEYAFYECESISTLNIPDSVRTIGGRAFYKCDSVKIYDVHNLLTNISSNGYNYVIENSKDYSAKLLPNEGFKLPQNILVKVGDIDLAINDYTYNSINGELIIPISLINENITIEAIGREIYEVIFDANDGEFSNGNPVLKYDDADKCDFNNIEIPVRIGYKFIGYYAEKTGGTSLENIMNSEAGIEDDITFYARWEEIPKQENVTKEEPSKELDETPKMGSNIQKDNLILITVLIATSIFKSLMIYKKSK